MLVYNQGEQGAGVIDMCRCAAANTSTGDVGDYGADDNVCDYVSDDDLFGYVYDYV